MHTCFRMTTCADPESFVRGGATVTVVFLIDGGGGLVGSKYHYKGVTIGTPAKRLLKHQWRFAGLPMNADSGSFVIFQGIRTSFA